MAMGSGIGVERGQLGGGVVDNIRFWSIVL